MTFFQLHQSNNYLKKILRKCHECEAQDLIFQIIILLFDTGNFSDLFFHILLIQKVIYLMAVAIARATPGDNS